jgi:hypothetical protein
MNEPAGGSAAILISNHWKCTKKSLAMQRNLQVIQNQLLNIIFAILRGLSGFFTQSTQSVCKERKKEASVFYLMKYFLSDTSE